MSGAGASFVLRALDRLYALALLAYPAAFRERFGREMGEALRDQSRFQLRERGWTVMLVTGMWAIAEVSLNGIAERTSVLRWSANDGNARRRGSMKGRLGRMATAIRHATRRLLRTPTFALITVLSVGFGAGAFAAIMSVVDGALLERPPYRNSERLIWVWRDYTWFQFPRGWLGGPDIAYLRERTEAFDAVVAFDADEATLTDVSGGAPEQVRVILASDEFFDVLGVAPLLGRGFAAGESDSAAAGVVVLGYDLWQRRYGGDPGIVGRDIRLYGQPQRVIGVMPRDFRFVMHGSLSDPIPADLYATLQGTLANYNPNSGRLAGMALVKAGAEARVQGALDAVAKRLDTESFRSQGLKLWSIGMREDLTQAVRPVLTGLFGAGAFLLLALAANLATLMVARAADRSRDVAVKSALGASRLGSVLDLVSESLLVCVAGCALGLLVAPRVLDALLVLAPPSLPRIEAMGVDGSVILITLGACLLLGLLAALGPAYRVASRPVWTGLRDSSARAGGSAEASRARAALVTVQVALSLMLLVGAGLMARSVAALLRVNPGFDAGNVLTFRVPVDRSVYPEDAQITALHARLRQRLQGLPGVTSVGAVNAIPLASPTNQTSLAFPGAPGNTGQEDHDRPLIDWFVVSPDYIQTMGIALLEGRALDERDVSDAPAAVMIDETLARRFFPGTSAVGHSMRISGDTFTVAGVVKHARFYNVFSDDRGQVYVPHARFAFSSMFYTLRTTREPMVSLPGARTILRELDANIPLANASTMDDVVRESLGQQRLSMLLLGGFAFGALVLATMGIYGVVANSVVRRKREFGVRLALGSERKGVLALVLLEGSRMIVLGLVLGLLGAALASRVLRTQLFGLQAIDPATFAAVTVGLGAMALLACLIPGWRATRIPPAEALRD